MKEHEIAQWIKNNFAPVKDFITGTRMYRCSATLEDETFLPCVLFRSKRAWTELAMKRFDEYKKFEKSRKFAQLDEKIKSLNSYEHIVANFVCSGNRIDYFQIRQITDCPYAIPVERMHEIKGETCMGWTQFTGRMKDNAEFQFGTTYDTYFFNMPPGYIAQDIVKVIPAHSGSRPIPNETIYTDKPFFNCYINT